MVSRSPCDIDMTNIHSNSQIFISYQNNFTREDLLEVVSISMEVAGHKDLMEQGQISHSFFAFLSLIIFDMYPLEILVI